MKNNTVSRLLGYLKNHKLSFSLALILAIISTLFSVAAPSITGEITTELYSGVSTGSFAWDKIGFFIVTLILLYIISQLFAVFQSFLMAGITAKIVKRFRDEINEKINKTTLNYYDSNNHGEILSVITNDVDTVSNAISQNLTQIVTYSITAIGIFVMMIRINIVLTIIAVIMVPVSLIASLGVMKASAKYYGKQQDLIGNLNGYIEEMYNGQTVVQAFNYQERGKKEFDELNTTLQQTSEKADVASGTIMPITSLATNTGYVISAILGCMYVISGKMTVGNVQAMLQYTRQFSQPFTSIANMAGSLGAAFAAAKRIFALLDAEEEVPDTLNPKLPDNKNGEVEFKNVSFGYTPNHLLMSNINLKIKSGQKVAIVGPTGAGKTTLINLLMRFYEINSGSIKVNGVDTREMTREELRSHFGMVLQDAWLFEGTIRENLTYSRDNISEEEMIAAAKAASIDSFIKTLPGSYDMVLSQGASNVSQGERQLLTIARAMAADPEIMILDEATSNVDTHTEKRIQKAMSQLMKGRTSFVIAHRLATIKDADVILYMENGDIKEVGNHDSLMKQNGKYASLYNSQFS